MTGTSSVTKALRNTSKGKLTYKRNLENETQKSTQSFFQGIAKKLGDISLRDDSNVISQDETDFKINNTFLEKFDSFSQKTMSKKRTQDVIKDIKSNQENLDPVDTLPFYENQLKFKTELKINSLISNLSNHLNEINEESNIKLSEIRQNFFICKLKWLEKYNHEWDYQYNQIANKATNYDIDQLVKSKLEKVEQDRLQIQNEIFKRRIKKLKEHYGELVTIHDELQSNIKAHNFEENQIESFNKIKLIKQKFELLLQKSKPEVLSETIVQEAKQQLLDSVFKLAEIVRTELSELSKKVEQQPPKTQEKVVEKVAIKEKEPSKPKDLEGFISEDDVKHYIELRKYKIELEESIKQFSSDDRYTEYRSNLILFIRTTANSLSSNSQEHIRDKIERYSRLFGGQKVEFRDKPLSINDHKDAFNYCIYHTANSFLTTGLKQALSCTKSALSFAQVMVYLWIQFEEFGKILIAFFFEMCPYTVPFYPPRDSADDEVTYMIACGYSLKKDGSIEEEEVFLNKMRALIKLYASMIQIQSTSSPLNAASGWKWLASILNLEPRSSISPAVLHSFLTITDSKIRATYGKQFVKLIHYIKSIYLPKINDLNLKNPQARVQLESYIDELMRSF